MNQEKALMKLKKICEGLKGKKITENCYQDVEIQSKSDITKSDFTPMNKSNDNATFYWNSSQQASTPNQINSKTN